MTRYTRQLIREQRTSAIDWLLIVIGITGLIVWATDIAARFP